MTEDQQMHAVMKTYADLVRAGVEEHIACHLFISCGLTLPASCGGGEHLAGELAFVDEALADAKAKHLPRAGLHQAAIACTGFIAGPGSASGPQAGAR